MCQLYGWRCIIWWPPTVRSLHLSSVFLFHSLYLCLTLFLCVANAPSSTLPPPFLPFLTPPIPLAIVWGLKSHRLRVADVARGRLHIVCRGRRLCVAESGTLGKKVCQVGFRIYGVCIRIGIQRLRRETMLKSSWWHFKRFRVLGEDEGVVVMPSWDHWWLGWHMWGFTTAVVSSAHEFVCTHTLEYRISL